MSTEWDSEIMHSYKVLYCRLRSIIGLTVHSSDVLPSDPNLALVAPGLQPHVCQRPLQQTAFRHHTYWDCLIRSILFVCVCLATSSCLWATSPQLSQSVSATLIMPVLRLIIQWIKQLLGGSLKIWTLFFHEYSVVWLIGIRSEVLPGWVMLCFEKIMDLVWQFHYTCW